jgi:hypothetical protein
MGDRHEARRDVALFAAAYCHFGEWLMLTMLFVSMTSGLS